MDCDACRDAPLLEGFRRRAADGEASTISPVIAALGVERRASAAVGLDGVAARGTGAGDCAGTGASAGIWAMLSRAREAAGLVSRVAVAVATDSASVSTSARSGSTTLLSAGAENSRGASPGFVVFATSPEDDSLQWSNQSIIIITKVSKTKLGIQPE